MFKNTNISLISFFLFLIFFNNPIYAESESKEIKKILETIQKDIKTLEKAVYSENSTSSQSISFDENSEDVLTRHLLKLSEIENQFQELTNKFEEINFKLDKLSTRLSKVQADNQMRFQQLESKKSLVMLNDDESQIVSSSNSSNEKQKVLPGSSEPQDLGTISYKDTETNLSTQQTQSIETTSSVVTEEFYSEEKLLPDDIPEKQYEFATSNNFSSE